MRNSIARQPAMRIAARAPRLLTLTDSHDDAPNARESTTHPAHLATGTGSAPLPASRHGAVNNEEETMHNVTSKKNKLDLQVRGLGHAPQPVVESDLASIPDSELANVSGGEGDLGMAFGRTRSCGMAEQA
jgi:hypothetical protein